MSTVSPSAARPATSTGDLVVHRALVRHGATVLVDVEDLRLEPGRALTVVGESGSGKSVLAHALVGTLPAELVAEGSMSLGEASFDLADRRGRRRLWGREVALLPQEPALALDPTMRVRAQVAEGARGWRPRDPGPLRAADERLDQVGLPGVGGAYPHTLSGGMAQRVAYAAATVGGARVLVVDEPSKGLDPASLDRLADLLTAHLAGGGLLLTITHDLRLARRLGGDVLVVREAGVVEAGPVDRVLDEPAHAYTRRLVAAEPGRWRHPWTTAGGAASRVDGGLLVTARGLTKAYAASPLFVDLDLQVREGERWSVTGPSGVGKTTLGNALLGLTRVDRGVVEHAPAARGGRLQKLYQDPSLSFPRRVPLARGLRDVVRRHGVDPARLPGLLEQVGLSPDLLARRPDQVSGGELQRVAVVRAMLARPTLVCADEATSRLDHVTQETTAEVLATELLETGCALLLVTHDAALADALTDHHVRLEPTG